MRQAAGALEGRDGDLARELLERQLDSLSEMGEMEALRLQMALDRISKLTTTLANLSKKSSDTAAGIVANMK